MSNNIKITATCAILDRKTDKVITERHIGVFDTCDAASTVAFKERKDGETVCLYNVPIDELEELSAREMAECEYDWSNVTLF